MPLKYVHMYYAGSDQDLSKKFESDRIGIRNSRYLYLAYRRMYKCTKCSNDTVMDIAKTAKKIAQNIFATNLAKVLKPQTFHATKILIF